MTLFFIMVTYRTIGGARTKGRPVVWRCPPVAAQTEWDAMVCAVSKCRSRLRTSEIISVICYGKDKQINTR